MAAAGVSTPCSSGNLSRSKASARPHSPSITDVAEGTVPVGTTALIPYSGTCGTQSREGYIFTVYFLSTPVPAGQDPRDPFTLKNTLRAQSLEVRTTIGYRNIDGRPATGFP